MNSLNHIHCQTTFVKNEIELKKNIIKLFYSAYIKSYIMWRKQNK